MKRHSTIVTFLLIVTVVALFTFMRRRRDGARREQRERAYEMAVASYAKDLGPGMTRETAHDYLRNHGTPYRSRTIGPATDDLIQIAREPSPRWYCSWLDVSVQIESIPASGETSEPQPDDPIRDIKLDRWLQDCL
jgi:hypothetical protein